MQSLTIVSVSTSLRVTSIIAILQVPVARQRQWLKHLLFECTILISLMTASYAWTNTYYKNKEVYVSVYKAKSGYGIAVKPSTIMTT